MNVKSLLDQGCLDEAFSLAQERVRAHPVDYRLRTQLFALCCFVGDFDRAAQQLSILSQESKDAEQGAGIYRSLLSAAAQRERVLSGAEPGHCLLEEPSYLSTQLDVIRSIHKGDFATASAAAESVNAVRHPQWMQGKELGGYLRDADDRIAPFAEIYLHDRYVWLPWEQVRAVRIAAPVHLRDLLFAPVTVEFGAGPLRAFMPVLYPATAGHTDPLVRLGRMTVWAANDPGLSIGSGARLLTLSVRPQDSEESVDVSVFELGTMSRRFEEGAENEEAQAVLVAESL